MCPSTALFFLRVSRVQPSCGPQPSFACRRARVRCLPQLCSLRGFAAFPSSLSHARLSSKHTVVCSPSTRSPHDLIGERVVHAYTAVCRATEFSCACVEVFVSICAGLRVLCFGFRGRFLVMFFEMRRICGVFAVCCG